MRRWPTGPGRSTATPLRLDRVPTHRCHGLYRGHPESREPKGETMTPNTALDSTTGTEPNRSIRTASLAAGIALLLLSALSIFGFIVVVQGLVTPGDPAQTAKDITESSGLFRLGIAALYLVIPLDIVVGWALYRVFSPVNKSLSMLAATLRVAFAVVFMVAISRLVDVLRLLDSDYLAALRPEQLHAQVLLDINA